MIWIIGECGEDIPDAPFIIEAFVDKLAEQHEQISIKNSMLTACVKLFLKRPPEMHEILAKLMNLIINNEDEDIDIRDRAVFYCKGFQDISQLKKALTTKDSKLDQFWEDKELLKQNLALEFNTLAVVFEKDPA